MDAVIVLGSWDSGRWAVPREIHVARVVRGTGLFPREYAVASTTYAETGVTEWLVATLRGSRLWRVRAGRDAEAVIWPLADPDGPPDRGYEPPHGHAAVGYVTEGDLDGLLRRYHDRADFGRGGRRAHD